MSSTETSVRPLNPPFLSIINLALHIPAVRRSCCMLSGFMLLYAASFSNHSLVVSHISPVFYLSTSSASLCPWSSLIIILMLCDIDPCRTPTVCLCHDLSWLQISHDHKCASRERCKIRASSSFWFASSHLTGVSWRYSLPRFNRCGHISRVSDSCSQRALLYFKWKEARTVWKD